ncbi:hypothetical protein VHUM_03202 [Vanrija humicola]|uniref:Nucleolar pre-ribosomal-associated protein 1 N-terminal domain-containing protein n=1 Tax=Vanrija humicola TaxID=5417 RepID=A0A7D8YUX0_VANHU|nr:hypothetical protein VHUM_03202 [Vanrija humicola]
MSAKRKRGDEPTNRTDLVQKPVAGTKSFPTGAAVRNGLATGTRQALVSFHQQILTPYSSLPLPITHPTVLIIQHYLDASPTADEIFNAWKSAEETKNEKLAETAALLLALILRIITPLPFFRTQAVGIVNKLLAPAEQYDEQLGRLLQSGKRENILAGMSLAAAAIHVDEPDPTNLMGGTARGRLAARVWASITEGGSVKGIGKMLGMRRRTKEGAVEYGDKDPLDRPDIRHLAIDLILPLLPIAPFHIFAKGILPHIYSGLAQDPPTTVYRVLTAMWAAISGPPPGIARRISLTLLDEAAILNISQLLERGAIDPVSGRSVGEIAEGFLLGVTTDPSRGICFADEGWYPRQNADVRRRKGLHNRILSNVVKRLGNRTVDDEGRVGGWVIKMFEAMPELVADYWPHSALSLEPRLDTKWIATMAYVGRVVSLPLPAREKFNQPAPRGTDGLSMPPRAEPPAVSVIVESVLPSPLTKVHLTKGLQNASPLVQHVTSLALARGLQKLAAVQALFASIANELEEGVDGPWVARARELELECRRRVPEVSVIVAFAQKSSTMARPQNEDDEVEPSVAARSAMLTETALRLFGLYYKTLPSLTGEAKFDVGKLLVSSSSAGAERRARREAREGSVISDSGSVGSIGTLGTVGMGGGFGHSRGDVEGFEALSQLHVLRLLSEVRDWSWMNKAAGSQYTYLYHILQLHLSTRNNVTNAMTTTLLHRLLVPSLLFEHDPVELEIWLNALPRISDTVSGPMFIAQQIYLLSFLDDCVRRATKAPHKYIEEAAAVVPNLSGQEVASPLLLTMCEQLHAKLMGLHIATEAAAVVINYLRRVVIGLLGKQGSKDFVAAIIGRIGATVQSAKDAGQPRHGLAEIVGLMSSDLDVIFEAKGIAPVDPETPKLVDEADYSERSFERQCVTSFASGAVPQLAALARFINTAAEGEGALQSQFLSHFFAASRPTDHQVAILRLLAAAVARVRGSTSGTSQRLKSAAFNDADVRSLFLSDAGNELREQLLALAKALNPLAPFDRAVAEYYALEAVLLLESKKVADELALSAVQPWIPFLSASQVSQALEAVIRRAIGSDSKKKKRKSNAAAEAAKPTLVSSVLGDLVESATPEVVYPHLADLLSLGAYKPVFTLLKTAVASSLSRRLNVEISSSIVKDLASKEDGDAYNLLSVLVSLSPSAADALKETLGDHKDWLKDVRLLPTVAALDDIPDALASDVIAAAVTALSDATLSNAEYAAAQTLLCKLSSYPDEINKALRAIPFTSFDLPLAQTAAALADRRDANLSSAITILIDLGLQFATRRLSSGDELAGGELQTIAALTEAIKAGSAIRVEVNTNFAEPAITAIVNERLDVPEAMEFGALLSSKAMLKAGFVRQQLQTLVASKAIGKLALPSADSSERLGFIRLLHALFLASTYVSCQPNFIEPLVPLYRGTLSTADRLLLSLFQAFETQRKLSVTSVLKHWSPAGAVSHRAFDALTSLDAGRVFGSCAAFPLRRTFAPGAHNADPSDDKATPPDDDVYDPVFVLSLLVAAMQEELSGLDWVEILRSNVLGLAVCALTSRDVGMRTVAGYALSKSVELIKTAQFHEQLQVVHTLELVSHALPVPEAKDGVEPTQPRLPPLIALFIVHALRAIANPASFFYPLSSRFLLQRPTLDVADVPALYGMLYASGDGAKRERAFIVRLLKDGARTEADWRILARRNTWSLLASLFQSSLDTPLRNNILGAMNSMVRIPAGARSLLSSSLVSWLRTQWDVAPTRPASDQVRNTLLDILEDAIASAAPKVEDASRTRWVKDAEQFVVAAAPGASGERLLKLSNIALRLALLPGSTTASATLPALVAGVLDAGELADSITENLFRISLLLAPGAVEEGLAQAVKVLAQRMAKLDGRTGQWARGEARRL